MIKIEVDLPKINQKFFSEKKQAECSAKVAEFMKPFVPRESGNLMENYSIEQDEIIYNAPYARKMYYGNNLNFSKEMNPLATSHWNEAMVAAKGTELAKEIERIIKKS